MRTVRWLMHVSVVIRVAIVLTLLAAFPLTALAQLKVMISGGFSGAYRQVLPEFEKSTGISVTTGSGASQGKGPQTIAAQLKRGVEVDVVILSREGLAELMAAGRIVPGSDVDLARVPLGAAVRVGAPKPDVGSVEALKRTLSAARTIVVPGSTSGIFLTDKVFPELGIADRIHVKVTERGTQATAMVAAGEADIALMPVSELMHVPGLDVIGRLPDAVQLIQVFAAALVVGSKESDAGTKLIRFLASRNASAAIESNGMELVAGRGGN